jgi:intracellular multiplication protein IcmB
MFSLLKEKYESVIDGFRPKITDYCDCDTPIDAHTFVTDDGHVGTVFDYKGMRKEPLDSQYEGMLAHLRGNLSSLFKSRDHDIHFTFEIEPSEEAVKNYFNELYSDNIRTMKTTGLGFEDLYEAKSDLMKKFCVLIDSYFVLWTSPIRRSRDDQLVLYPATAAGPKGKYHDSLLSKHLAAISVVKRAFDNSSFECEVLIVQKGIKRIRRAYNGSMTPLNYMPTLFPKTVLSSNKTSGTSEKSKGSDVVFVLPPKLNTLLTPGRIHRKSFNEVEVGSRLYSSFDIKRFPSDNKSFNDLISQLILTNLPVRLSTRLSGGGHEHPLIKTKSMYAMLSNSKIRNSLKRMKEYVKSGGVVVGLQSTVSTWVDLTDNSILPTDVDAILKRRVMEMVYAVQGWGSTEVDTKGYDAIEQYTNNIPGFRFNNTAPLSAPPITDAINSLPLYKVSNIWNSAIDTVFMTKFGQPIPFKRFSKEQKANTILISGMPGAGKSVMLNELIISLACHPNIRSLPFIGIIDIKPSSFGALGMIRDELPENKKHLVVMSRVNNNIDCCINPHDTHYGARHPTQEQHAFITDFWSLVTQDIQSPVQNDEVKSFLEALITECYRLGSDDADNQKPKKYNRGVDPDIDKWIENSGFEVMADTIYWEIFDYFHSNGEYKKAARCQKYAVPVLQDLILTCTSSNIEARFLNAKVANGTDIIKYVSTRLTHFLNKFPAFSSYTRLDFPDARIIALDLQPVANNSTLQAAHQTSIFYMLAQSIVSRNFLFDKSILDAKINDGLVINSKYHEYHKKRFDTLKDSPKGLYFDEFHMTSMMGIAPDKQPVFSSITRSSIATIARVSARVENIEVIIVSQNPLDFTVDLRSLYTTGIIMGAPDEYVSNVCEIFGLHKHMENVIPDLGNPGSKGSSFIMVNKTKKGIYSYTLLNPIPSVQLWGTSTTNEDVSLRTYLYDRMGSKEARALLAKNFPGGTAVTEIEQLGKTVGMGAIQDGRAITDIMGERLMGLSN